MGHYWDMGHGTWDTIGTLGRRHNSAAGATTGGPPIYIVPILDCHHNISLMEMVSRAINEPFHSALQGPTPC